MFVSPPCGLTQSRIVSLQETKKTFLKVDADLDIKKEKKLIKKTEYHFRLNLAIEQIYILIFFVFLSLLRISVSVQTSASIRPFFLNVLLHNPVHDQHVLKCCLSCSLVGRHLHFSVDLLH